MLSPNGVGLSYTLPPFASSSVRVRSAFFEAKDLLLEVEPAEDCVVPMDGYFVEYSCWVWTISAHNFSSVWRGERSLLR